MLPGVPKPDRRSTLPLLAVLPALAVLGWWALDDGGYAPTAWLPGTLVVVASLVVAVVALGRGVRIPSRAAGIALAALGAYAAWSLLSVLWADAPGPAFEGTLRTIGFLAWFALFCVLPWTRPAAMTVVVLFVLGIAAIAVATLIRVTGAADVGEFFADARLATPLAYQNANASLWTIAAFPALLLASRRELPLLLRPFLLAAAGLLLGMALLSVSRGWLFTLPVPLIVALVLVPGRLRLALFALPIAVVAALIGPDLLEPYDAGGGLAPAEAAAAVAPAFDEAARSLLIGAGALLVVGLALALADRQVQPSEPVRRRANRVAAALLAALVVAGAIGGLAAADFDPFGRLDQAWTDFRSYDQTPETGESRLAALGTTRYDFWRVSLDVWRDNPLGGVGQDNFAQPYLVRRATPLEEPRWTHSLELRLLVHTGIVGLLLFAAFVVAAGVAALRRWRAREETDDDLRRTLCVAAILPAVVWLAHGSVDWLWEYPALSASALALTGLAAALRREPHEHRHRARSRVRRAIPAVAGLGAVLVIVAVAASWLAELDVRAAARTWPEDPPAAFQRLDRARALAPLQARPSLVEGIIALRMQDLGHAREALERASDREPADWFAQFELGLLATVEDRMDDAKAHHRSASLLNPLDPVVREAVRRVDSGRPMDFAEADRAFSERAARRFGRENR